MITIENVLNVIPALGVIIALVYYTQTLRNTSRARQRELVFQRFQGYSLEYTRAFEAVATYSDWEGMEDWNRKYGHYTNPEASANLLYVLSNYNARAECKR